VNIYLRDGKGTQHKVLGEKPGVGLQNFWKQDDVEVPKLFFMSGAMGRNFFYGIDHPDHEDYGFEIRESDFGLDDWIMNPAERYYGSHEGTILLVFVESESLVAVSYGEF
jgi:hypothetical protein